MKWLGGHLGASISALVDGQLDAENSERAWDHVVHCPTCRALVERERWVKRQLGTLGGNEPSARLLGTLHELPTDRQEADPWASPSLPSSQRPRRLVAAAAAGAGGVSMAVLGFAALSGVGLGGAAVPASIKGGVPTPTPTTSVQPVTYMTRLPAEIGSRSGASGPASVPTTYAARR